MINKFALKLKYYLELSKLKIMIPVSLTGFTGYFIFDPHLSFKSISISIGILFMAVSASVLNQIQEVELDSKMDRTLHRPLPTGKISMRNAVLFFLISLITGTLIIFKTGNFNADLIGLITIIWYNGIYT